MRGSAAAALSVIGVVLLGGCAPDAVKSSAPYDAFLTQVQNKCYYTKIGMWNVGDILTNPGNMNSTYFTDITSRLYFGRISRASWIAGVTGFAAGSRESDSGIACVLAQLDAVPRPPAVGDGTYVPPPNK